MMATAQEEEPESIETESELEWGSMESQLTDRLRSVSKYYPSDFKLIEKSVETQHIREASAETVWQILQLTAHTWYAQCDNMRPLRDHRQIVANAMRTHPHTNKEWVLYAMERL